MDSLGRLFDIGTCFAPVDVNTADLWTGKRISMARGSGCTFVFYGGVGGADDLVFTVQQHTASVSGTSSNLASATVASSRGLTYYWIKAETALDNDETWVKVSQSEAATATVVGATYGAMQKIVVFTVQADQLGDGYTHISVNGTVTGTSTAQLTGGLYILHDLRAIRSPELLGNLLNPGAANA